MVSWRVAIVLGLLIACAPGSQRAPSGAARTRPPAPRAIAFPSPDGGVVSADVYGAGPRAVVLAHGGRFDKSSWAPQARALADAGFRVVAIDFRGRGASRAGVAGRDSAHLDLLGALRYLRAQGVRSIAMVGGSFGGGMAAEAVLAAPGDVERLVLLAHSPIERPERLTTRVLFVVARGDTTARGEPRLVAIRDQYDRAPAPKELLVLEGSAHAQFLFASSEGERLLGEIVRFLTAP